ncbi:MAG: hypothetical protein ACP5N7_07150 [Candidatus Pacearchaeota archaeon]
MTENTTPESSIQDFSGPDVRGDRRITMKAATETYKDRPAIQEKVLGKLGTLYDQQANDIKLRDRVGVIASLGIFTGSWITTINLLGAAQHIRQDAIRFVVQDIIRIDLGPRSMRLIEDLQNVLNKFDPQIAFTLACVGSGLLLTGIAASIYSNVKHNHARTLHNNINSLQEIIINGEEPTDLTATDTTQTTK